MNEFLSLPPLAWLANYLLHSTVLLGAVWLLDISGVLASARRREFVWRLAFFGALLTASVQFLVPSVSLTGEPQIPLVQLSDSGIAATPRVVPDAPADTSDNATTHAQFAPATTTVIEPRFEVPTAPLLLGLWLFGALFLFARIAWTARLAMLELSTRQRVTGGPLHERLHALCERAQSPARPPLAIMDDLPGPLTLPNGEICVPRWAGDQLETSQLDAMLAHELAHVRRCDPLLLLVATLLEALLFVQPLNRVAHRRLAALAELNADADAAQLTGNTRALAEALAECAQHIHAHPAMPRSSILGVAMARRRSPIIYRVERLLGGITMNEKQVSGALRSFGIAVLFGGILLLPAFGAREATARNGVLFGTSVTENDGEMTFEIGRPGYFLRVQAEGKVQFTADGRGIAWVEEDGRLRIREKRDGVVHELVVTNVGGEIQHAYSRDGDMMLFDDGAREWLAVVVPKIVRNTAIDAEGRIERLYTNGGVDAVLKEMKLIDSDHALAIYASIFVRDHDLDERTMQRLLSLLREVDSDFELRQALANVATSRKLSEESQHQVLQVAANIGSDFELAELLQLITPRLQTNDRVVAAWRSVVDEIGSDFELRRTLAAVFEQKQLEKPWKVAALQAAAEGIGSDFELRSLLDSAAPHINNDSLLVQLYIGALNEIGSDFEARQAIAALVEGGELGAEHYSALLNVTRNLGSDFETSQALQTIAAHMPRDATLVEKYRQVTRKLSAHERQQAEKALD